ncbi:MAG: signal recognition particle protein [Thermaerobacter sp.]|nr:signal recognition particle protein [Thermaerobacter sp.]
MFESLTDKLNRALAPLRKKGKLTAADVQLALRDVRLALLEADVNFRVVKSFVASVEERAVGESVLASLTPAQAVIRVVRDELVALLGPEPPPMQMASRPPTVFYLVGLQGAGKTTAAAKLARVLLQRGRHPLLVAADIYRPAAVDQLERLAEGLRVPVLHDVSVPPPELMRRVEAESRRVAADVAIIDTAGRLHVDATLMDELVSMQRMLPAHETLLVVDAMTGQDAVNVATAFRDRLPLTGIVLTKMDGDARGGAALSMRQATGLPIKWLGVSEKLDGLEAFQSDRMAGRILGMGDVLGLIERAEASVDQEATAELAERLHRSDFTLDDFQAMLRQVKKMGPVSQLIDMIPGLRQRTKGMPEIDDHGLVRVEAMLSSMTSRERRRPQIIDGSRRRRIARGSGTSVQEVNRLLQQHEMMRKMMRQAKNQGKRGRRPGGGAPPGWPPGMPPIPDR